MMTARDRRFAIALLLALAAHAGLLAAVTQGTLTPDGSIDRAITVTLTTRSTNQSVDSPVLAQHAQRGRAALSRKPRGHQISAGQQKTQRRESRWHQTGPEHVQRLTPGGKQKPAARKHLRSTAAANTPTTSRPRMSRQARSDPRAAYLNAWRRQVEHYGNQHYPGNLIAAAPRRRLTLVVTLQADGSVQAVKVRHSSGSRALDKAARAIVHEAAPYTPFPDKLRQRSSRLTFAYDWVFGG